MTARTQRNNKKQAAKRRLKATGGVVERQQIPTPTLAEVVAALAAVNPREPVHGPALDVPLTVSWRTEVPRAPEPQFTDPDVERAITFISGTTLIDFFEKW